MRLAVAPNEEDRRGHVDEPKPARVLGVLEADHRKTKLVEPFQDPIAILGRFDNPPDDREGHKAALVAPLPGLACDRTGFREGFVKALGSSVAARLSRALGALTRRR